MDETQPDECSSTLRCGSRTLKKDILFHNVDTMWAQPSRCVCNVVRFLCQPSTCAQRCALSLTAINMCATLCFFFDTPAHLAAVACRTRCEILLEHTWPAVQSNSTRAWASWPKPSILCPPKPSNNQRSLQQRHTKRFQDTWNMKCSVR